MPRYVGGVQPWMRRLRWVSVPGYPPGHHLNIDGLHGYQEFCVLRPGEARVRLRLMMWLN